MKYHVFDTVLGICIATGCKKEDAVAQVMRDSNIDLSAYEPVTLNNEIMFAAYMAQNYPTLLTDIPKEVFP